MLALVVEHENSVIGDVLLWLTNAEHRIGEIGWVLDPAHGGQGLAAEACALSWSLALSTMVSTGSQRRWMPAIAPPPGWPNVWERGVKLISGRLVEQG